MIHKVDDRNFSVGVLAGITIAAIGLESPALAVPQPAPILMSQVACVISKTTPVYTTANPEDSESRPVRPLTVGTAVIFVAPLPANPPARVQIKQPTSGFIDYAALNCGKPPISPPVVTPPPTQGKLSVCRTVRNTVRSMNVHRAPSRGSEVIDAVGANQIVYVTQTGGGTTSLTDASGEVWVEVDLQRTFRTNVGTASAYGWLSNTESGDRRTTLVNGCP